VGDIIKEINHRAVNTVEQFQAAVGEVPKGDTIQMFIRRLRAGFTVVKITK